MLPLLLDFLDDLISLFIMFATPVDGDGGGESQNLAGTLHPRLSQLATEAPMPPFGGINTDNLALLGITPKLAVGDTEMGRQLFEGRHGLIFKSYLRPTGTIKEKKPRQSVIMCPVY
jgi:hypothetical protein